MSKKSFKQKDGTEWSWNESNDLKKFKEENISKCHVRDNNRSQNINKKIKEGI